MQECALKSGTAAFPGLRPLPCPSLLARLGNAGMSRHYDQIKNDVAFRKDVAHRCGVGFGIPASLASVEPSEPNFGAAAETEVGVTA